MANTPQTGFLDDRHQTTMAGAFSGHLVDSYRMASSGQVLFNHNMHGTQASQAFSMFGSQGFNESTSEATMMKIAQLQEKLNQKLGPEYVSQRPGAGGQRLTYAEGWKIINLANEVFGFNGWSTNIINLTTDFIDVSEGGSKFSICVSATVRVTLRDGVYHEDVGCGTIENTKNKGQGLDKCKKEAVTDAVKRALRNFGNLLGNCMYDKQYTQEIVKIKVPPAKFDKSQLHRRPEFEDPKADASPSLASSSTGGAPNNNLSVSTSARPQLVLQQSHQQAKPYQQQPSRAPTSAVQVKAELQPNSVGHMNANKGKAPQRPMQSHIAPPPQKPAENKQPDKRVSFAQNATASSSTVSASSADIGPCNSFPGFSDDDDLFASVCLEDLGQPIIPDHDLGRPIAEDADLGRPIDYPDDEPVTREQPEQKPPPQTSSKPSSRARLEAIIAAQFEQQHQENDSAGNDQLTSSNGRITLPQGNSGPHGQLRSSVSNENRNPNAHQGHGVGVKQASISMGGFQFPAGMPNPLQSSSGPGPGAGAGMKRPADLMSNHAARGSRPGMGLQQAQEQSANGRQVLGRFDNADGGDIKRMRR